MKQKYRIPLFIITILVIIFLPFYFSNDKSKVVKAEPNNIVNHSEIIIVDKVKEEEYTMVEGIIYAYNSEPGQTDSSPFITASGLDVREKKTEIIANNCLPFGTEVEINNKIYVVEDRMNKKYGCEIFDIWMENKLDALEWGKQKLDIKIK